MRFLEWMNNKLLQSSIEPFKDFGLRSSCLCLSAQTLIDDNNDFESSGSKKHKDQSESAEDCHYSYYESNIFKQYFEDEPFPTTEYFNGFLTIGTLGAGTTFSGPETPTFSIAFEKTSKSLTEVTEEELKLANYKLEKFLEAECKDDWCDESSGRTSFVSAITFTGKQMEGDEEEVKGKAVICPLQGYLFGSSIELQERAIGMKKDKTAIDEAFCEKTVKQANNSTSQMMKKILKKFNGSSNLQRSDREKAADSKSTKKKLFKVLQFLHRKIHPESSPPEKKSCLKHHKEDFRHENKSKFAEFPNQISKFQSKSSLPQDDMNSRNSTAKDGHWIRTDADYLVLELRSEGI